MKNLIFKIIEIAFALGLLAQLAKAQDRSAEFQYLQFQGQQLQSVHSIKHNLPVPKGFRKTQIFNHKPTYNGHPFNVTTAGLHDADRIIMVHAEIVTDNSGFLDYSYMDSTRLDGLTFYSKETCLIITDEILSEAKDLKFFQGQGFNFLPAIYMKQFFKNSEDGNQEYVLSYAERVTDCSSTTISNCFKKRFRRRVNKTIEFKD